MEKIHLEVIGMSYSQSQSTAYALILGEKDGKRRLPIIIGGFEAQSIAIELEKIKTPRPLTHDLFHSFADAFKITLKEVIINKFSEGIFYALLVFSNGKSETELDSRTSDAIALALRFGCPIYTFESIMAAASIVIEEEADDRKEAGGSEEPVRPEPEDFSEVPMDDLKQMLEDAIINEEYERASRVRDELKKRK
jgi:bifunctional DNase/RNase